MRLPNAKAIPSGWKFPALTLCGAVLVWLFAAAGSAVAAGYQVTLSPSLTTSEEYTDNASSSSTGGSAQGADWLTRVSPGISLNANGKIRGFGLAYSPTFTYYARNSGDSDINQYLNASYWEHFTKHLHFNFSNVFSRQEQAWYANQPSFTRPGEVPPIDQPVIIPEYRETQQDTTRRGNAPYNQNTTRAGLTYQFGPSDSLGLNYAFTYLDNTDPDSEDSTRHSPTLNLTHWITPHLGTETRLHYEHGEFTGDTATYDRYGGDFRLIRSFTKRLDGYLGYSHDIFDSALSSDDYTIYQPYVGMDYQFTKDSYAGVAVGYYFRDKREGDDDSGMTVEIDLGTGWSFKRGSIRLSGSSGYDAGYGTAQNLGFNQYYGASLAGTYELAKRLTGTAGLYLIRQEYLDEDPVQKDTTATATVSLGYEVRKWLFTSLRYSYRTTDSNVAEEDYDENRVMLQVTLRPEPLRLR